MEFHVFSRSEAKKYFYRTLDHDCVVISITDTGNEPVHFPQNEHMKSILRLSFDDTDADIPQAMQNEDAEKIVAFVSHWKDFVQEIVLHCEAGVSRSAGVCSALMLWLNGSDKPVFDNTYFRPNMRCRRLVLNRLESLLCEEET